MEGQACADPGARTPIGASGNFVDIFGIICTHECRIEVSMGTERVTSIIELEKAHSKIYWSKQSECAVPRHC